MVPLLKYECILCTYCAKAITLAWCVGWVPVPAMAQRRRLPGNSDRLSSKSSDRAGVSAKLVNTFSLFIIFFEKYEPYLFNLFQISVIP